MQASLLALIKNVMRLKRKGNADNRTVFAKVERESRVEGKIVTWSSLKFFCPKICFVFFIKYSHISITFK